MSVRYEAPWPVTSGEVDAIDALMDAGAIRDGETLTVERLHELLECEHTERPCPRCLKAN